jgi:ATP-binding cassette subfamily B protein
MTSRTKTGDVAIILRLLRQALPYWPQLVGMLMLGGVSALVKVLNPLPLKVAVDNVLGSKPPPAWLARLPMGFHTASEMLVVAAALVMAVALLSQLESIATKLLRLSMNERLLLQYRRQLFEHAQRLPLTYHDRAGTSDTIYRVQNDCLALASVSIESLIPFVTAAFTLVTMAWVALRLDWLLTLIAFAVLPGVLLVSRIYRHRLRQQSKQVRELESQAMSVIHETLTTLRVVRAFGQEQRELDRYVQRTREGIGARTRLALAESVYGLLVGLATAGGTALVLYLGVRHVRMEMLSLGDLFQLMTYLAQIYSPVKALATMPAKFQSSLASAERAYEILDSPPAIVEKPDARPLERARGAIAFENVSFTYDQRRTVLCDVNFAAAPGMRIGIAGKTGAGKTTFINLLARLLDPTTGRILLDGVDLRDYRIADLRRQFAVVLQEPVLFSTSIAENIAYARPQATTEQIESAAKAANAHDFIAALPDGYRTEVGERGMSLSGGERQRICLARAFLTDAPILILDEPTSSVDVNTEGVIMEAMQRLMRGRTTFMIAHRLGTLRNCDVLLRLDHGRIIQVTSHGQAEVHRALAAVEGGS